MMSKSTRAALEALLAKYQDEKFHPRTVLQANCPLNWRTVRKYLHMETQDGLDRTEVDRQSLGDFIAWVNTLAGEDLYGTAWYFELDPETGEVVGYEEHAESYHKLLGFKTPTE